MDLSYCLFPSSFYTKILYKNVINFMRATFPAYHILCGLSP
jgi:hypothetical protein